jgi:hypothetical protein
VEKYDTSTVKPPVLREDIGDGAADDRVREEFMRDYMESQQRRNAPQPPPKKKGEDDSKLKGPRLGGSRSARAAMHASLQKGSDASTKK